MSVVIGAPELKPVSLPATVPSKRVALLLDETGSMEPIRKDTIGSVNAYIRVLKDGPTADLLVTIRCFNSQSKRRVLDGVRVGEVEMPVMNYDNYVPAASTPLYDAMGELIDEMRKTPGEVLFVTVTDGEENSSKEYKKETIAALITEMRTKGWEFAFLGTNFDAYKEAASLGIARGSTMTYHSSRTSGMMASNAAATKRWFATSDHGFSDEEKAQSGDKSDAS